MLIKNIKKFGDSKIAAEMLAMRQLIKLEADDMVKLARMLDDAGNTVDDVAKT